MTRNRLFWTTFPRISSIINSKQRVCRHNSTVPPPKSCHHVSHSNQLVIYHNIIISVLILSTLTPLHISVLCWEKYIYFGRPVCHKSVKFVPPLLSATLPPNAYYLHNKQKLYYKSITLSLCLYKNHLFIFWNNIYTIHNTKLRSRHPTLQTSYVAAIIRSRPKNQ